MRKVIPVGLTWCFVPLLISCLSTEHGLIKDITFQGLKMEEPNFYSIVTDTLKARLLFRVAGKSEYQSGSNNNPFVNNAAMTIDNRLLVDSVQLRLNSDIYVGSDTIKSGTDLWNHHLIKDYKWYQGPGGSFIIGFSDDFYQTAKIPNNKYSFELTCKTNDNLSFTKTLELYFKE